MTADIVFVWVIGTIYEDKCQQKKLSEVGKSQCMTFAGMSSQT